MGRGHAPGHLHDLTRMKAALRTPAAGGLPEVQPAGAAGRRCGTPTSPTAPRRSNWPPTSTTECARAVESLRAAGAAASAAAGGNRGYRPTADYLGLEHPPMTSLRDVAEGIPFIVLSDRSR